MVGRGIDVAVRMDEVEDADLVARSIYEGKYVVLRFGGILHKHGEADRSARDQDPHVPGFDLDAVG